MIDFNISDGIAYYIGKDIITETHSHHALEFVLSLDNCFTLNSKETKVENLRGCIILPNVEHQFIGTNGTFLFIFLDPELIQAKEIIMQLNFENGIKSLISATKPKPESILDFTFFKNDLNLKVSDEKGKVSDDKRLGSTIEYIKSNLHNGEISSDELAANIFLSPSRFGHLFKSKIGIPVRKYILWSRLNEAVLCVLNGKNLTESAHLAGFSDSAHLSRTFKEMFGISPSTAFKK